MGLRAVPEISAKELRAEDGKDSVEEQQMRETLAMEATPMLRLLNTISIPWLRVRVRMGFAARSTRKPLMNCRVSGGENAGRRGGGGRSEWCLPQKVQ